MGKQLCKDDMMRTHPPCPVLCFCEISFFKNHILTTSRETPQALSQNKLLCLQLDNEQRC